MREEDMTILRVYVDKDTNRVETELIDDENSLVFNLANYVGEYFFGRKDDRPLTFLLSIVANVIARDDSGRLEEDAVRMLKNGTKDLRKMYAKMISDLTRKDVS